MTIPVRAPAIRERTDPGVSHVGGLIPSDSNGAAHAPFGAGTTTALMSADRLPAGGSARTLETWFQSTGSAPQALMSYGEKGARFVLYRNPVGSYPCTATPGRALHGSSSPALGGRNPHIIWTSLRGSGHGPPVATRISARPPDGENDSPSARFWALLGTACDAADLAGGGAAAWIASRESLYPVAPAAGIP